MAGSRSAIGDGIGGQAPFPGTEGRHMVTVRWPGSQRQADHVLLSRSLRIGAQPAHVVATLL